MKRSELIEKLSEQKRFIEKEITMKQVSVALLGDIIANLEKMEDGE